MTLPVRPSAKDDEQNKVSSRMIDGIRIDLLILESRFDLPARSAISSNPWRFWESNENYDLNERWIT
jgi:hypothetical protein